MSDTDTRRRIEDGRLAAYENQIARQNRIMRQVHMLISDLDPDTLAYVMPRLNRIMAAAKVTKEELIREMNAEKAAARQGRDEGR